MLNGREKDVIESLLAGWIESDMMIPGHISYQDVIDLMNKFGIDSSEITRKINKYIELIQFKVK